MTNFQKYVGPNRLLRSKKIALQVYLKSSTLTEPLYPTGSATALMDDNSEITVTSPPGCEGIYPAGTEVQTLEDEFGHNIVVFPQIQVVEGILTDDIAVNNAAYNNVYPNGFLKLQIPTPKIQTLAVPYATSIFMDGSQTIPSIAFSLVFMEKTIPHYQLYINDFPTLDNIYFAMGISNPMMSTIDGKNVLFIPATDVNMNMNIEAVLNDDLITIIASGGPLQSLMQLGGQKNIEFTVLNSTKLIGVHVFRSATPTTITRTLVDTDYLVPVINRDTTRWFEKGQYAIAVFVANHWELIWSPIHG